MERSEAGLEEGPEQAGAAGTQARTGRGSRWAEVWGGARWGTRRGRIAAGRGRDYVALCRIA